MKRFWKYIKPYLGAFVFGPILMIVEVIGEVLLPKLMANIINIGAASHNVPYIIGMGIAMIASAFLMMAGGIGGAYFAAKAAISFSSDLRSDLFDKVQKFSFSNLDQFSTGSLVTRLTNDITQVQNLINMALRMMLRAPGLLIGALIMAIVMNAKLAVVVLIVIPILVALIMLIIKIAFPRFEIMQKKLDFLNSNIQEVLTNVRVIKSFVRSGYEEKKFADANEDLKQSSLSAFKVVIFTMPLMMCMMNVTTLAVVWFGGNQILAGSMPVGDLTAFTTYIVQILMSLMMLAMVLLQSSRALASLHRITEVLDTEISLSDENCGLPKKTVNSGRVEFQDVSFRYYKENKETVLSHISFKVESGQTLGIIGSTGSGKTTLVQMIPRLYDVDEGRVLVDGVDDEMKRAAKAAQADEFVNSFTEGYRTELGQGGVNVSGGQKQRLCIARALLKKPKILILDDSTSAVDTATEAKIRESFSGTLKNTTKIIIAQRITSVMDADEILVLDEGQIVGMGSHEHLLKDCEAYQEIYYSQMDREVSAS